MDQQKRAQCEKWEQLIIDGATIAQLSDFDPDLMMTYWQAEGFRPESLPELKRQFESWFNQRAESQ